MTNAQAFLIGACLLAGSIILTSGRSGAQAYAGGPYQLMHHSNTTSSVGVFRLDQTSGEVSYCFLTTKDQLVCSTSVK